MGGITVSDLIELLQRFPQDAKVFYRDGNYSGPSDEFTRGDVEFEGGRVLINCPYWQAL